MIPDIKRIYYTIKRAHAGEDIILQRQVKTRTPLFNPFVIVLAVVLVNEPWFFSHQSIIYRTLMSATEERLFEPGQTVKLAFYHVLVAVIAVAVSFPYWKYIGLIK